MMQEAILHKRRATFVIEVDDEVFARTPEEAESLLESEGSEVIDRLKELGVEAQLLEVFAYPEEDDEL
jgi:hypothetical protein